jgi:hypothetical protein
MAKKSRKEKAAGREKHRQLKRAKKMQSKVKKQSFRVCVSLSFQGAF